MIVRDECGWGNSWMRVSAGAGNFSQLRGGWGNTFVFPRRSLMWITVYLTVFTLQWVGKNNRTKLGTLVWVNFGCKRSEVKVTLLESRPASFRATNQKPVNLGSSNGCVFFRLHRTIRCRRLSRRRLRPLMFRSLQRHAMCLQLLSVNDCTVCHLLPALRRLRRPDWPSSVLSLPVLRATWSDIVAAALPARSCTWSARMRRCGATWTKASATSVAGDRPNARHRSASTSAARCSSLRPASRRGRGRPRPRPATATRWPAATAEAGPNHARPRWSTTIA